MEHAEAHEPDEHRRFADYLDELRRVGDADEMGLVRRVLADPVPAMARSAVLRHLDRRAADLYAGPAYEQWAQACAQAVHDDDFLTRRLCEWSLFRAVVLRLPWQQDDLSAASDWLQLKIAADPGASTEALELLADRGRTKRIRATAGAGLKQRRGRRFSRE
ncbi:hypothetical protein [Streptomyces sp. enrichment culture]|uniref:hypothetical protein n=1 Tax=Streptomyces sp. enrichment culture TaxID=1795815 RepID=UPI003F56D023